MEQLIEYTANNSEMSRGVNEETTIKVDNSTQFKDFVIEQKYNSRESEKLTITLDETEDSIMIGDFILAGLAKKIFLEFINQ